MGFGYNRFLAERGERLDMLDYFSWMKRIQQLTGAEWFIWDASGYWIVNKTPKKRLPTTINGKQLLEILVDEQNQPERSDIRQNCDQRAQYLQRLIQASGITARYLDSRMVFRQDESYVNALDGALEYVDRLTKECPELVARISPPADNPFRGFYLPLETAEALYLLATQLVQGKFGPESERDFDAVILGATECMRVPYLSVRSPLPPTGKPGYLADDGSSITTKDAEGVVEEKLANQPYAAYVRQYLAPFRQPDEPLIGCAVRMQNLLEVK